MVDYRLQAAALKVEPTHIYVCGPMRGYEAFNFPAFFAAEAALRQRFPQADICNPAREDVVRFGLHDLLREDPTGYKAGEHLLNTPGMFTPESLREVMSGDLHYVTNYADLLVALEGWQDSKGAKAEISAAEAVGCQWVTAVFTGEPVDNSPHVDTVTVPDHGFGPFEDEPRPTTAAYVDDPDSLPVSPFKPHRPGKAEVRTTSASGGQKGVKAAQFDQIPPDSIWALAEHFGKGAAKYDAHNFRRGYPWSWSYNALLRHSFAFWGGEDWDVCKMGNEGCDYEDGVVYAITEHGPTCRNHTGSHHLDAVMWHGHVLRTFYDEHKEYDDRYVKPTDQT